MFFAVGTPYETGVEAETEQTLALINAAKSVGVSYILFSSIDSVDQKTGIPHFDSKLPVERHLSTLDIPNTIMGPVFFMENLVSPWWLPGLKGGALNLAMPASRPLKQIAVADLGKFYAHVITNREKFVGKRIDIASDEVTGQKVADTISELSGKKIDYVEVPLEDMRKENEDFALMFEWFDEVGFSADIAGLRKDFPDIGWHTFDEWAREQDWKALLS